MTFQLMFALKIKHEFKVRLGRVTLDKEDTTIATKHGLLVYFRRWLGEPGARDLAQVKLVGSRIRIGEFLDSVMTKAEADEVFANQIDPFTNAN